jgi:hypothetical protein
VLRGYAGKVGMCDVAEGTVVRGWMDHDSTII